MRDSEKEREEEGHGGVAFCGGRPSVRMRVYIRVGLGIGSASPLPE
jgi:hypothetical protein